jgi:hypothetical protein
LDVGVPEYFSVPKCYSFPFPTLPNQETIPASISPNRIISLEEKAGISTLARDACSSINQGSASVVQPKKVILRYFTPRQSRLDRFQQLRRFRRLVSTLTYGFEDLRFFRKVDGCMWMPRVLGRDRNERVVRVSEAIYKKGTYFLEELIGIPCRGTFAGNRLKPFYPRTQMEYPRVQGTNTSLWGDEGDENEEDIEDRENQLALPRGQQFAVVIPQRSK